MVLPKLGRYSSQVRQLPQRQDQFMVLLSLAPVHEELLSVQAHCTDTLLLLDHPLLCHATGCLLHPGLVQIFSQGRQSCRLNNCGSHWWSTW